ncbi:MAG: extracellular solute-binding protein [Eubacteriales bacterium]|nr:extracellular solute-binding protein [Eubacteriales bacterium]
MRVRKVLAVLCGMTMMASLLAGCGGSSGTAQQSEENTTEQEETTEAVAEEADDTAETEETTANISGSITVWEHSNSFESALEAVVAGFSEKYPDVEVEWEIKDGDTYYSLLSTAIQSGEAPDVFWTNGTSSSNMADLVSNGALMDLSGEIDFSDLEQDSLQIATIDGKQYSVPWMTLDTRCCYYNKDIFEQEGWTVPTTFDEFEELLAKQKEAGYTPISQCLTDTWSILFTYEPVLAAMEPEYVKGLADYSVKATDEPAANALNKMLEWKDAGYYGDNVMGVNGDATILAFTTGKAVMYIGGSWSTSTISGNNPDLNYGAFQIPDNNGTRGMVGTYANGFSIYQDTENAEAAKAFVQYCASLEGQTAWVQATGGVSGSPKIEASSEIVQEISDAETVYTSWQSVLANYAKEGESATTIWEEDSVKLFEGSVTTDELMDNIAAVMQ